MISLKYRYYLLAFLVLAEAACSTKRDSTAARLYHNTTAHYNGYFNAEESVKKGVEKITAAYKEDYDKVLPIFIYGDEESAKAAYPEMEKAITKCEKVITKHTFSNDVRSKEKDRPVFNKWIDDNYMVIGRAYFYKRNYARALETFKGVNARFKDPETQVRSNSWLARAYTQKEDYSKAIQILQRIEAEDETIDEAIRAEYHLVYADVYLHQEKPEKAAEEIKKALPLIKKKRDRARPHFILAQLYQQMGRSSDALTHYEATIKSRPPYELEFYARINKALAYSRTGGSSDEIQKALFKMLRDEKNDNYRDQIYYALGDIAWEEQRRADALDYYQKSLDANKDNPKQRAKTFLRLADIYFDERQYAPAQAYYDSTLTKIDEKHERYSEIKGRAENLTELIENLEKIALYDSLGAICKLSPIEREKRLADIQKGIERQKQEQRRKDEEAAAKNNSGSVVTISGTFWAYNEPLRKSGQQNFKEKWGDRPLKDNWRLQSRLALDSGPGEEQTTTGTDPNVDPVAEQNEKYKVPSIEELRSGLPCGDMAKLTKLEKDAAEGYYLAGVVYKEKFDDDDNAISTWEELLANIDTSDFHPTTHYQLYRTWLNKESTKGYLKNPLCSSCNSAYWAKEIKRRYPDSDWAYLVDNPDYVDMKDIKLREENKAYEAVYAMYNNRNFYGVITVADSVILNEPDNHLLCKYRLLRAISTGYTDAHYGIKQNYQNQLNELVNKCAGSDEAKRAQELLKAFSAGDPGITEDKTDESNGKETTPAPEPADSTTKALPEGPFKYDAGAEHYMALIMPVQGTDINKVKASVADFNTSFFASSLLKVTNNLLNKDQHLLLVKSFKMMEEANNYIRTFDTDSATLKDVNNGNNITFLISKQNYIALFKSKDLEGYLEFYKANYK